MLLLFFKSQPLIFCKTSNDFLINREGNPVRDYLRLSTREVNPLCDYLRLDTREVNPLWLDMREVNPLCDYLRLSTREVNPLCDYLRLTTWDWLPETEHEGLLPDGPGDREGSPVWPARPLGLAVVMSHVEVPVAVPRVEWPTHRTG